MTKGNVLRVIPKLITQICVMLALNMGKCLPRDKDANECILIHEKFVSVSFSLKSTKEELLKLVSIYSVALHYGLIFGQKRHTPPTHTH